jgi:hypothetical protein
MAILLRGRGLSVLARIHWHDRDVGIVVVEPLFEIVGIQDEAPDNMASVSSYRMRLLKKRLCNVGHSPSASKP